MPKYNVTNLHAIVVNYFVCFATGSVVNQASPLDGQLLAEPWFPYALFLSLTFIIFFNVNAFTIQKVGMVITSVFQKLSLVFPVLLGLFLFGEASSSTKVIAIILTILSIIFINWKSDDPDQSEEGSDLKKYWYWPLLVFFGSGLIESVLFYAQETGKVQSQGVAFVTILFFMAGCWGFLFLLLTGRLNQVKLRDVIAGIILGVPNFFTIYLLIRGLELGWDGSVLFPLNNVGVIFLTAIVGIMIFREKLNKLNYAGLAMALWAVYLISG